MGKGVIYILGKLEGPVIHPLGQKELQKTVKVVWIMICSCVPGPLTRCGARGIILRFTYKPQANLWIIKIDL